MPEQSDKNKTFYQDYDNVTEEFSFYFDEYDTVFHVKYGIKRGERIIAWIYSKTVWSIFIAWAILTGVLILWLGYDHVGTIICRVFFYIFGSVLLSLILSSANKTCVKKTMRHFEAYIKFYYFLQYFTFSFIYDFIIEATDDIHSTYPRPTPPEWFFLFSGCGLLVVTVSFSDALRLRSWAEGALNVITAIVLTILAAYWSFFAILDGEDKTIIYVGSFSVSVISMMGNALQVLTIFFWRQALNSIVRHKQCSIIRYAPYIKWMREDRKNNQQTHVNNQINNNQVNNVNDIEMGTKSPINMNVDSAQSVDPVQYS